MRSLATSLLFEPYQDKMRDDETEKNLQFHFQDKNANVSLQKKTEVTIWGLVLGPQQEKVKVG